MFTFQITHKKSRFYFKKGTKISNIKNFMTILKIDEITDKSRTCKALFIFISKVNMSLQFF